MRLRVVMLVAAVLAIPGLAQAAGDAAAGKAKAAVCTACHGVNGKAMIPSYPHLAGQQAQYLELALKAYKNGERTGGQAAIMSGMAKPLSDEDIANLAAYFSSL
ncbi:cytochrome c [Aestuariicella hydrocarbonica]|uniref:Cytochrome c n=1 Tax=Pseudomaricurvus hydrocarbonicus TaxID=1470433 RepID=A0A9E5MNL8_9GAMM|nr:cytochrome c [Aestuariicella hydrocarbonica]NHO67514.1 cytochrome c [Aestuariicella hydrocarbonica]